MHMEGKLIMSSNESNNIDTLDGGMGHMIKRLGVSISGAQKGAIERFYNINMVNLTDPELVQNAHISFLNAGSNVITTNNYAVVPKCLRIKEHMDDNARVTLLKEISLGYKSKTVAQILAEEGFFKNSEATTEKVYMQ